MIGLLLALYPARWRRRYGEEFRAVLESRPLGPFDVADVLIAALDACLSGRRYAGEPVREGGQNAMLRIGGYGAVIGGIVWVAGFVGASLTGGSAAGLLLVTLGTVGILLALIGLSAFQAHRQPRLAWAAFASPAIGAVVSLVGLIGMVTLADTDAPLIGDLGSWEVWSLGAVATLVGCVVFGAATARAGVLSRAGAIGLAVSSITTVLIAVGAVNTTSPGIVAQMLLFASLLAFAVSWIKLGLSALADGPIRATAPA